VRQALLRGWDIDTRVQYDRSAYVVHAAEIDVSRDRVDLGLDSSGFFQIVPNSLW
jgi:hypothetical protein